MRQEIEQALSEATDDWQALCMRLSHIADEKDMRLISNAPKWMRFLINEMDDALDLKNGNGPTALSRVVGERDALQEEVNDEPQDSKNVSNEGSEAMDMVGQASVDSSSVCDVEQDKMTHLREAIGIAVFGTAGNPNVSSDPDDTIDKILEVFANDRKALVDEVERLKIRDDLFTQLREQIKEYFGKDGGLACLQDGYKALVDENKRLCWVVQNTMAVLMGDDQGNEVDSSTVEKAREVMNDRKALVDEREAKLTIFSNEIERLGEFEQEWQKERERAEQWESLCKDKGKELFDGAQRIKELEAENNALVDERDELERRFNERAKFLGGQENTIIELSDRAERWERLAENRERVMDERAERIAELEIENTELRDRAEKAEKWHEAEKDAHTITADRMSKRIKELEQERNEDMQRQHALECKLVKAEKDFNLVKQAEHFNNEERLKQFKLANERGERITELEAILSEDVEKLNTADGRISELEGLLHDYIEVYSGTAFPANHSAHLVMRRVKDALSKEKGGE